MKTLEDVVLHFLKDMYYAEKAVLKLFPELVSAAEHDGLKKILLKHADQTKAQIARLEKVFSVLGKPVEAVTCEAIIGLVQETDDVVKHTSPGAVRDAALVACVTAIEHYEIARYGTIASWLEVMGHAAAAALLRQSMQEDSEADAKLNDVTGQLIKSALAKS
jgi:ferritin-like metal-binding protein YciE